MGDEWSFSFRMGLVRAPYRSGTCLGVDSAHGRFKKVFCTLCCRIGEDYFQALQKVAVNPNSWWSGFGSSAADLSRFGSHLIRHEETMTTRGAAQLSLQIAPGFALLVISGGGIIYSSPRNSQPS